MLECGGARYSARLLEIRAAGFRVDAEHVRDGCWLYTLIAEPEPTQEPERAPDLPPDLSSAALFDADEFTRADYRDAA